MTGTFSLGKGGIGRIRLQHLADASGASLIPFAPAVAQPGTTIRTDNWDGYKDLPDGGFPRIVVTSRDPQLAHLVASLLKRWLLGTYQGAVQPTHLAYHLDETGIRGLGVDDENPDHKM